MLSADLDHYLTVHSHPLSQELAVLAHETKENFESNQMLSGPLVSTLLRFLVRICRPKLIVDLGTYTGFSALSMVEVLQDEATLMTCEIDPLHIKEAKKNFQSHPKGHRIEFFEGCAFDCLHSLKTPIDLAFLDANKNTYLEYYHLIVSKLRSGGVLVMDDALWKGRAISPSTEREKRMDLINKIVVEDPMVENLILPIRNGVNLIYKL